MTETSVVPGALSRRTALSLFGVVVGSVTLNLAPAPDARAAGEATTAGITLEPVSDSVGVLSADAPVLLAQPRELGFRVVNPTTPLPAGTSFDVTYDERVYVPAAEPIVTRGGRAVTAFRVGAPTTDAATGLTTRTVTVQEELPPATAGDALTVVIGTADRSLYPFDLLHATAPTSAELPGRTRAAAPRARRRLSGPAAGAAIGGAPWGVEMSAFWDRRPWGEGFVYYFPSLVTLRSVGPAAAPAPVFTVALDPRVVKDQRVAFVRVNGEPSARRVRRIATPSDAYVLETQWAVTGALAAGDVLDVGFTSSVSTPSGPLPTVKHPVVSLGPLPLDARRRDTGLTTVTRLDSIWGTGGTR